ncbi:platelet-activating factor acetylhydrolase IB subunit alpha2 [Neocloeon triangulifer]|uniref:platelet-activating factor acetylhydrolase IB subunit alpha2 n=1 Tax=Neocloeon triangulifer TaxID=2078957 RepID=UPI00286EBDCD|nr:platelet-activating factor acetylhydrolase IB subunit alpha2 [Neocloeon triangulifer]
MNPATTPVPPEDVQGDGRWMSIHNRFVEETTLWEPEVLFIGDSLIRNLTYSDMWKEVFVPMHPLNFGIGGDQTQHVLWRVLNGELEHIKPKVVVLLVGTNNIGHSPEQIVEGIREVVKVIQSKQPQAYLVLIALLPRGQKPNPLRERNDKVNLLLKEQMTGLDRLQILDLNKGIVHAEGTIDAHDMDDYLHLTPQGYRKTFEPLHELLTQLLSEGEVEELEDDLSSGSACAPLKIE